MISTNCKFTQLIKYKHITQNNLKFAFYDRLCLFLPIQNYKQESTLVGYKHIIITILALVSLPFSAISQREKVKNQPYADQKLYHLGFLVGINAQDVIIMHSGFKNPDNSTWFTEIPSYSPGFSVGFIADRYLNQYMNLRLTPTIHFGSKNFLFKEQTTGQEYNSSIRTNYISLPLNVRFYAQRLNNFRPFVVAGGYLNNEIGKPKEPIVKFKNIDYGLEIGLGCNFYFPMFKLSPELKFSFGLKDIIDKDRSDLTDKDKIIFTNAIKSGKSRMITLIFNFE